jgi:hypothetical protein
MRQSPAAAGYPANSHFFWIPDSRFAPSGMTERILWQADKRAHKKDFAF